MTASAELWNRSMVERVIAYFYDPDSPSARTRQAMQDLVEDFLCFEKIVDSRAIESGDANRLAWGFIHYYRKSLKQHRPLYDYYKAKTQHR